MKSRTRDGRVAPGYIGRTGDPGSIEDRIAALRAAGHTVTSTVTEAGLRTLTIDGMSVTGATFADCLAALGVK